MSRNPQKINNILATSSPEQTQIQHFFHITFHDFNVSFGLLTSSFFFVALRNSPSLRKPNLEGSPIHPIHHITTNQPQTKNLGGGFKYFSFSPLFGEDSHFD